MRAPPSGGTIVLAFCRISLIDLPARTWQIGRRADLVVLQHRPASDQQRS